MQKRKSLSEKQFISKFYVLFVMTIYELLSVKIKQNILRKKREKDSTLYTV